MVSGEGAAADAQVTGGKVDNLKSSLNALANEESFDLTQIGGSFARGNLYQVSGTVYLDASNTIRVSSTVGSYLPFDKATTISADSGYKFKLLMFSNGSYQSATDFVQTYTTDSEKQYLITIQKYPEESGVTADINTFLGAVKFDSVIVKNIKGLNVSVESLASDVNELEENIHIKSENLYNPALQTPETISPHYYFAGVPYSTTQFDNAWNCTALIEIEPSTQYTLGLVPAIGGVTKPWNNAGAGGFCYDSNGNYITSSDFTSNTFTTPANAKYIRFNYAITGDFNLSELNSRCMLVKGSTLPETYEAYVDTTLSEYVQELNTKVEETDSRVQGVQPLWYKRTGTTIEISHAYSSAKDIVVTMQKFGGNDLFDLKSVNTIPKGADPATAARTQIWDNPSDAFSPYVVAAVNNIDGDSQTVTFTGGQHQYNNTGSGSTPTARTVSVAFYADKREVSDGETGNATHFRIVWENRVQGYNTKKSDGTGREILKVIHTADFNGEDIKVSTNICPLEDVKMTTFYGFQFYAGSLYPAIRYFDSTNRLVNTIESSSSSSNSGDLVGYSFQAANITNGDCAQVSIDPLFDLGKRNYATGQNAMFVSYNKAYFSIVRNETSMSGGSLYSLKGAYKFEPVTV